MPPQTQRPSRSAQRLDEYQRFQTGQQAQQGQMMQQLVQMYGINRDQQLLPGQLQGNQYDLEAKRIANEMSGRTSANQPTVIEQQNRAGEQTIAQGAASTRNLNSTAVAQEYENFYGKQNAKTRANSLGKQNIGFGLQNDLTGLNIDRYKWENGANMLTRELEDAAKVATTEQAIAGKGLTEQQTLALQKSLPYITRNADEALRISRLQGGLIQANIDRSNATLPSEVERMMIEIANLPAQYAGQSALTAAQAQNIRATSAFGAFDRGLVNGMQGAELAVNPTYYNKNVRPVHERVAAERAATQAQDKARQTNNLPITSIDLTTVPPDLQAAFAEQNAQMQAFYQKKQLRDAERAALLKRAATQHQLQQMQNADLTDFSGSYSY